MGNGLTFEVAQKIEELTEGSVPLVKHLIAQNPQSPEAVEDYLKSINCWGDGSMQQVMEALYNFLDEQSL